MASVYAVYNSVFSILKAVYMPLRMRRGMGFGQLISARGTNMSLKVFFEYQFFVIWITGFVVYGNGVNDALFFSATQGDMSQLSKLVYCGLFYLDGLL